MAREVMIAIWCDRCAARGEDQKDANEVVGVSEGGVRMVIDLCSDCIAEVVTPFHEALDSYGRVAKGRGRPPKGSQPSAPVKAGIQCPECERKYGTDHGVLMHRIRAHDYKKAA